MRTLLVLLAFLCLAPTELRAQDVPPPEGTEDAPPELVVPAIPEGYVVTVHGASNEGRLGPGPGEMHRPTSLEGDELPPLRSSDPVERVLLELGGAVVSVGASLALGYAVGLMEGTDEARTASTLIFAYMFLPTYTWLFGSIMGGGSGNWGGAFIGESVGACLGGLFAWWAMEERSEEGMWTALLLLPSLGAILGLEIQHTLRLERHALDAIEHANRDVVVSMSVAPVQSGGALVIRGQF